MIPPNIAREAWAFGISIAEYHDRLAVICEPLLLSALRNHAEHAKTWPGGWVRWTNPVPWRTRMLIERGSLVVGSPEDTCTSVHITDAGTQLLQEAP